VGTKYFQARGWKNKNKILSLCEGGNGVKTGYTKQAGRCLVASATRNGMTIVCTVLHCPTMFERATLLLDDAFSAYENKIVVEKNGVYEWEKDGKRCKAQALSERCYPMREGEENLLSYTIKPLKKSQKDETGREILAVLEIRLAKHLLFLEKLYKL
jgi:D-alanyl-D-alanine carboxypeptidase (penicillin-binding protein 5/6)